MLCATGRRRLLTLAAPAGITGSLGVRLKLTIIAGTTRAITSVVIISRVFDALIRRGPVKISWTALARPIHVTGRSHFARLLVVVAFRNPASHYEFHNHRADLVKNSGAHLRTLFHVG